MSINPETPDSLDGCFTNRISEAIAFPAPGDLNGSFTNQISRSMVNSSAIATAILPKLMKVGGSVAFLRCGNITGTGFLLTKNVLITCRHVNDQIAAQRRVTNDPQYYKTIFVHFDYQYPEHFGNFQTEVDEATPRIIGENVDYVIYWLKGTLPWVPEVLPRS
jgi:hypothetical protein